MGQELRHKILSVLLNDSTTFLSGEEISKRVGVSRAAIWKHIEELRNEGYQIDAKPRKGYQLIYRPDRVAAEEIQNELQTLAFGRQIRYEPVTKSTQILAHQWARAGAPEGSLVIADEQKDGKGRLGRVWYSPPKTGVWMSLVLRPSIPIQQASHLTLLASVGVSMAIMNQTNLPIQIKWPNDLLLHGKKICGILTELRGDQDKIDYVVLGMGINVNQQAEHFPSELREVATSLAVEGNHILSRASLIAEVMKELECYYHLYLDQGFEPIRNKWESLSNLIGKKITAKTPQKEVVGVAESLSSDGSLLVRSGEELIKIYSADIDK
ncbi:biotin--[acetyl-CoA-carboxylase] ligase [Shimazuella sp. AN120528]|uniref:biotin--[acetyl-CoA-carboxylase] ligase n=1 Tax=Shimazuella soli TaxID=1892854 RepID=UPI001F118699|nr:biotin--[acetyl-CoA-carboxylase] ligase [Shimazuella soli]MCH5585472.1 biotin--[acetyl-CoA-carboxylase] ligase [Shimazuella soli]